MVDSKFVLLLLEYFLEHARVRVNTLINIHFKTTKHYSDQAGYISNSLLKKDHVNLPSGAGSTDEVEQLPRLQWLQALSFTHIIGTSH
jgi:hypothetical protein